MRDKLHALRGRVATQIDGGRLVVTGMEGLTAAELRTLRSWLISKPTYMVRDLLAELDAIKLLKG
jgi:hypothetical protein